MNDKKQFVITLEYTLHRDNEAGEVVESTVGQEPLVFTSGIGQMIPGFEDNVVGLSSGDNFSFGIKAEDAYGPREEEAIIELPKEMFEQEGKLVADVVVGNVLALSDDQGGRHPGKVVSIKEQTITMDMNHLLAGQDLYFTGKILDVREATAEELGNTKKSCSSDSGDCGCC